MRPLHIDTNIYSRAMVGDPEVARILRLSDRIYISAVVIGELLSGFKTGTRERRNREQLFRFLDSPRVTIVNIGAGTADHYSSIYMELRKAGTPVPSNDMWIAAAAMESGSYLFSMDKHFDQVPGLLLIN